MHECTYACYVCMSQCYDIIYRGDYRTILTVEYKPLRLVSSLILSPSHLSISQSLRLWREREKEKEKERESIDS